MRIHRLKEPVPPYALLEQRLDLAGAVGAGKAGSIAGGADAGACAVRAAGLGGIDLSVDTRAVAVTASAVSH